MSVDLDALRESLIEAAARAMAQANGMDPDQPAFHSFQIVPDRPEPAWRIYVKYAAAFVSAPILSDLIAKAGRVEAAEKEAARLSSVLDFEKRARRVEKARATAAEAESERLRARQDAALRGAIRNWSARLHIPVTRMMSRALREEFAATLAATQPDSTEARHG